MTRPDPRDLARALSLAALVLATASRGDVVVLGLVLVLADPALAAVPAVAVALVASSWRWGSTSLEALAGAQSVLGPAVAVGPAAAAVGSCLAGAALLLALARRAELLGSVAVGASVAALVAGPGAGAGLVLRVVVAVAAALAAWALALLRTRRPRVGRGADLLALLSGVGAVLAVGRTAPPWPPHLDLGALGSGLAVAAASAAVAVVASSAARARWSGGQVRPRLRRPARRQPTVPSGPG